jgi:hypothetical protein
MKHPGFFKPLTSLQERKEVVAALIESPFIASAPPAPKKA